MASTNPTRDHQKKVRAQHKPDPSRTASAGESRRQCSPPAAIALPVLLHVAVANRKASRTLSVQLKDWDLDSITRPAAVCSSPRRDGQSLHKDRRRTARVLPRLVE